MSNATMLEVAIDTFGLNDNITIMISQKRDKEIADEQQKRYSLYQESEKRKIAREFRREK